MHQLRRRFSVLMLCMRQVQQCVSCGKSDCVEKGNVIPVAGTFFFSVSCAAESKKYCLFGNDFVC